LNKRLKNSVVNVIGMPLGLFGKRNWVEGVEAAVLASGAGKPLQGAHALLKVTFEVLRLDGTAQASAGSGSRLKPQCRRSGTSA
jgi:hypothetical protein